MTPLEIKHRMDLAGSHWWDERSMRFFQTEIESEIFDGGPGEYFFLTSEQPPYGGRAFAVRKFVLKTSKIETVGGSEKLAAYSRERALEVLHNSVSVSKGYSNEKS